MTNGQIVIGSTGGTPTAATITAGAGISVTNGAGAITLAVTGGGLSTIEVTGTSATLAANTQYIANNAGLVTLTLPAAAAQGDVYKIIGKGAGGWLMAQGSGQQTFFGSTNTTSGVGGSLASTNRRDCIEVTCITANTEFEISVGPQGNITVV